jgi:D-glycero-D-manno-heptose 1,7-bisphosphate phosphatase
VKDRAILFDRDGTLIVDHPGNRDPDAIQLMPHAADALALAREWGYAVAVVTNQPAITDGDLDQSQLFRMHARIEELAGPIDGWFVCIHGVQDGCECRKPEPGLILAASARLNVAPERCTVIGDIGADIEAALAAGANAVLVPTPVTRAEEIASAPLVAHDVLDAVRLVVAETTLE